MGSVPKVLAPGEQTFFRARAGEVAQLLGVLMLILQRTRVQFPAPLKGSSPVLQSQPVSPAPGALKSLASIEYLLDQATPPSTAPHMEFKGQW